MKLTDVQLEKLTDIFIIIGQIIFASTVVPFFIEVDKPDPIMLTSGWSISIICWTIGLLIAGRIKEDE